MSKIKYFLITSITIIFCFSLSFAQKTIKPKTSKTPVKKTFNDSDLADLLEKAEKQREGIPYRLTIITEKFENGKKITFASSKTIKENLPPDRERYIIEKESFEGNPIKREYIDIGRESFIRENDGEWKVFQPSGSGSGSGNGVGFDAKVEKTEEKNFVAGENLNGQRVNRYEEIVRYTYTYPNRIETATQTQTYWFNSAGLLIKNLDEWHNETKKTINRQTEYYEYNVKLKIEKPIVK